MGSMARAGNMAAVRNALREHGDLTVQQLAGETGLSEGQVRYATQRMYDLTRYRVGRKRFFRLSD